MDASTLFTRLETATASFRNLERQLADPDVAADPKRLESIARERSRLEPLVLDFEELQKLESERDSARQLLKDSRGDAAMEELAQDELASLQEQHATLTERLTLALLPRDPPTPRPRWPQPGCQPPPPPPSLRMGTLSIYLSLSLI